MNDILTKKLGEIIQLNYGKPITSKDRIENGTNPIYGANGVLGRTNNYLIDNEAIIVGRKGSAGEINRVSGKFWPSDVTYYILEPKEADIDYLFFLLQSLNLTRLAKGIKPGLNRNDVYALEVALPSIPKQKQIVKLLNQARLVKQNRIKANNLTDQYLTSIFFEMFGDPLFNELKWEKLPLHEFGNVTTGNTPSRNNPQNYGSSIEWIKSDNIPEDGPYLSEASEYLSETGAKLGRIIPKGSTLTVCIAGSRKSIGRTALANRDVAFNQQINAITPYQIINEYYLFYLLKLSQEIIQSHSSKGMKGIVTKGVFEKIELICPPKKLQDEFGQIFLFLSEIKQKQMKSAKLLEDNMESLMQNYF